MLELSIVIPVFNCLPLTQACLRSLEETIGWREDFEVIVVDNASTDGTAEWLSTLPGPRYRVLHHERNLGYAAANNAAARLANGRLLLLLNNDTVVLPGWLEPMQRVLERAEKAGLVGNIQREAESGLIDHAGILFTPEGVPRHFDKDAVAPPRQEYRRFPAVTGACWLIAPGRLPADGRLQRRVQKRLRGRGFLPSAPAGGPLLLRRQSQRHLSPRQRLRRAPQRGCRQFRAASAELWHRLVDSEQQAAEERREAEIRRREWPSQSEADERSRRERRRDGWRYIKKHFWQPWQYNAGRLRQAVDGIVARPSGRPAAPEPFFFE